VHYDHSSEVAENPSTTASIMATRGWLIIVKCCQRLEKIRVRSLDICCVFRV